MPAERFLAKRALSPLKAFQRRTVDYVFERFYGADGTTAQFLVADEVGLGKTMVARGVIARAMEHLWDTVERIDVLYICSNQAIAAQNINRLNVLGRQELALPTRMTLIPLQLRDGQGLDANKVNFISLTPGTTFDLRSATGVRKERALLYHLLKDMVARPRGLLNLLQVAVGTERWRRFVRQLSLEGVDARIIESFRHDVRRDRALFTELERVCELFRYRREQYPGEYTRSRNQLVGRLRAKLSHSCVDALEPDLIILDEFQRFRDLLHGDSDAAALARELFEYTDGNGQSARTLLLSATPYRMLTLAGDAPDDGSHYQDFLETISFLYGREQGPTVAASLASELREFRRFLQDLPARHAETVSTRQRVESRLRRVMSRTERIGSTSEGDAMLRAIPVPVSVQATDLRHAAAVADVARLLDAPEIVEYWKSSPYLLNFMRDYRLKQLLKEQADQPAHGLRQAMARARPAMLDRIALDDYKELEPANGRLRALMDDVFSQHLEQNLWIPPALPYYGEPRAMPPLTKALVFSFWSMVPDAVAALLSYEAERRAGVGRSGRRYFEPHRLRPLQFRHDPHGRPGGLRNLLLLYPSPALATIADPLAVFAQQDGRLSLATVRDDLGARLRRILDALPERAHAERSSAGADWSAPAVLDHLTGCRTAAWLADPKGLRSLPGEEGFQDHVVALAEAVANEPLPKSDEVLELLVDLSLGSPAICALRALHRIAPGLAWDDPQLLSAAATVAWGFRTLFNQHDAIALLREGNDDRYWRRVLTHGAEHNLQATLDEYAHYLVDAEGLSASPLEHRAVGVARAMANALSIRPSQIEVDDPVLEDGRIRIGKFQMRGRLAMRLADYRDEDGGEARIAGVRDAFNSPFRPFVLATTSVGQEGLDFHPYCYRVWHWNLPGNPVDLEQREGRVHRFKGHAVRLNLASRQASAIRGREEAPDDPWALMFQQARAETAVDSDMVPYWIYEGDVKVERRVPMLPFSQEISRLEWLIRSLTVYRLAFGQPRQDDLLEYLHKLVGKEQSLAALEALQIRLEPVTAKPAPGYSLRNGIHSTR